MAYIIIAYSSCIDSWNTSVHASHTIQPYHDIAFIAFVLYCNCTVFCTLLLDLFIY